jgi:hypothetical protein
MSTDVCVGVLHASLVCVYEAWHEDSYRYEAVHIELHRTRNLTVAVLLERPKGTRALPTLVVSVI